MALIFDNILYVANTIALHWKTKPQVNKKTKDWNRSATVLIPVKNENGECLSETLQSIMIQDIRPVKILVLLDAEDTETIKEVNKLKKKFDIDILLLENNGSKADALNRGIEKVRTTHTLILDVGDVLSRQDYLAAILRDIGDAQICIPSLVVKNGHHFVRTMLKYEIEMWQKSLKSFVARTGMCPVPGSGVLIRSDFLRRNSFPETLAEDAAIGFKASTIAFSDVQLNYNMPNKLISHLKQRARWNAGFLQNRKLAKTKFQKWLCCTPLIQALVPISMIAMPVMLLFIPYDGYWIWIDVVASVTALSYLTYAVVKFRDLSLYVTLPIWWFLTGLSSWIGLKYWRQKRWYYTPKSMQEIDKWDYLALVLSR